MANLAIPGWGNGGREDVITLFGGWVCGDTTIGVDGRVRSVGGVMEKGEEEDDGGGGAMHGDACVMNRNLNKELARQTLDKDPLCGHVYIYKVSGLDISCVCLCCV